MSDLKVRLITYTPDPERIIASAAKLCYARADIDTVMDGLDTQKSRDFIDMLGELGHQSPIEHISFTFGIENVSRALLAQITRHRIASFSVQSQRYVSEADFKYVTPPEIEADPGALKVFKKAMADSLEAYNTLADTLEMRYISEGMDKKSAQKKAIEDARMVLPNACTTKMIVTMNARSLLNFFSLRCCNRAQWEIRELATQMLFLVRKVAPSVFDKAGPGCLRGKCTEGRMSCGKADQVRAKLSVSK